LKGRYMGEGQVNYAHTRIFSEFQLGFMCDANLEPLKFLNTWFGQIFGELPYEGGPNRSLEKHQAQDVLRPYNRTNTLAYPEQYCSNIIVTKTESGPKSTTQRAPVSYYLERAWPYAIDAVPLQFGASQDLKIYHHATNGSFIVDSGTGNLNISASQVSLLGGADGAETMATFADDGAVTLYHNNSAKLSTSSTGASVTGTLAADTAVTATTSMTTATMNATTVDLGDYTITESAGTLRIAYQGTNKFKLDSSGNLTVTGNITAFGSI